jgi:DNA mismatch endonuclease (patch repair protein)
MADVFTKIKRSEVMSHIRGCGNKDTELALMRLFRKHKITGWRRQVSLSLKITGFRAGHVSKQLKGGILRVRPDFVFPKLKLAVFVDGCFWHCCPQHSSQPKTNAVFWKRKLAANKSRDRLVTKVLRKKGWKVLRIWEHDLTNKHPLKLLLQIKKLAGCHHPEKGELDEFNPY